jgi:hypothetical protein
LDDEHGGGAKEIVVVDKSNSSIGINIVTP